MLAVTMLCGTAFAQSSDSKLKFGVKAGVNFANISISYDGDEDDDSDTKAVTSFHFGGYADLSVSPAFSIQPGLTLSGKGFKEEESYSEPGYSEEGKSTTNVMYLEVPVNFVYKINDFYIGAGPYAAFALSGKNKYEYTENDGGDITSEKEEEDVKIGNGEDDQLKGTDFGINFMAGYQLKNGINLGVGYGLGLSNIYPGESSENYKIKNRVFSVSVGYSF